MGRDHFDVKGKSVLIAGGSKGLGRELALQLTSQGANVTILARSLKPLEETHQELLSRIKTPDQTASFAQVDLTDAKEVDDYITSLDTLPSTLFCVAGGTSEEIGFFADITTTNIKSCFERNYLAAAYISHSLLRRWIKSPPALSTKSSSRHIIFTASTAALVSIPGYAAYGPTKAATRALADTLRQEVLLYQSEQDIQVHCTFPGTIYTDAFYEEQTRKPALCKELEGSDQNAGGLTAAQVAEVTIKGLKRGKFLITMDMDTALLLNNMRGPSPRDSPVWDWILGLLASLVWPFYRWWWDRKTVEYGKSMRSRE